MTRSQWILEALLTGKALPLSDIRRMFSEASGKEITLGDISSLMAKLTPTAGNINWPISSSGI